MDIYSKDVFNIIQKEVAKELSYKIFENIPIETFINRITKNE